MQNLYQEDERNTPQDAADPTSQSTRLGEPATVEKPQAHSHSLSGPGGWIGRTKTMLQNDTYQRPLLIALGPLPILCFVWGVFVVSYIRPIPLPDHLAVMVSTYPQSATVIAAITATILSSLTSFFFSLAARYLISIHLVAKSTPLEVLTSVTHIAQRVLWLHDPRFEWTWIVFLAFLSTNLQTPCLTSFFNVRRVRIDDPINGYDLDMTDPQLIQISNNTQLGPVYNAIASFFLQNVMVYAMRLVQRNIPTTFYFNNYTYVSTTGGIHPATYVPNYNEEFTMNFTTSLPPNLKDLSMKDHIRLPFNKTMSLVQQGFTAEVDCRVGNSKAIMVYNATLDVMSMGMGLSAVKLQANCPGNTPVVSAPVVYNTSDTINSGGILGVTCQIPGTDSLEVIIRSSGAYGLLDFTTCTVSPKTTLVNVVYTTSAKITDVPMTINVSEPIAAASVPIWGKLAIDMLMFNINLAQGIQENTVGNAWLLTGVASREITLDESMNVYIRASIEFIGTAIRQIWTLPGTAAFLVDPSNSSFFTPISGTLSIATYGWHQDHSISPLLMLPTTVTILVTYVLLIYGVLLARKYEGALLQGDARFDPTDFVHVVAAHAPETRQHDFRVFSQESTTYMRKTMLKMESKDGVRAFQVSSS